MLDGRTPMHWASAWNKLDLLGLLIEDDKRKSSMRKSSIKKTYKVRNKVCGILDLNKILRIFFSSFKSLPSLTDNSDRAFGVESDICIQRGQ